MKMLSYRMSLYTSRNDFLKCMKSRFLNRQTKSTSVPVAAVPKIDEVSQTKEASPPSSIIVDKYVHPNLMTEIVVKKQSVVSTTFEDIPGPRSLFLISKFWNAVPKLGSNKDIVSFIQNFLSGANFFHNILCWGGNKAFFEKFFRVYGPVVRLHGAFHSDVILLRRPEHARQIFQQTDMYPIRSCLECIQKYRLDFKKYDQAGLFLTSGNDWKNLRESLSQPLIISADKNYDTFNEMSDTFVQRILSRRNKFGEVGNDFDIEIYRWFLESFLTITLNKSLGFLNSNDQKNEESDAETFIRSLEQSIQTIGKCEYAFHLWKFVETSSWKFLVGNCDIMDTILSKHVDGAVQSILDKKYPGGIPFLEFLIANPEISRSDVMTMLMDMVLIGSVAITHTVGFLLYHLSRNTICQKKLREEIGKFGDRVRREDIEQMTYLHACIKEVLRLNPPLPILSRVLTSDIKIMEYTIPKNTRILFASHLNGHRDEYFEEAERFKPERWLGSDAEHYDIFANMPFGHGPRSCLAKELSEKQIAVLIFKICRKFQVDYDYGKIESSHKLLASPSKPLKFRFTEL